MIDLITITKANIPDQDILSIVDRAKLQECTRNGKTYYETSLQQRNKEHLYIRLSDHKLKIECSLHKIYEQSTTGHYTNYGIFTLEQAKKIAYRILADRGIEADNLKVYGYEIGLNLYVTHDCRSYMDKMQTIGVLSHDKFIYNNPKYKDHRVLTTLFHRHIRKHFKAYDKGFEARDKRRGDAPDVNILRIETVYRRVENMSFEEFFSLENIAKIRDRFFRDWRTIQFTRDVIAPKGTGSLKRELCKTILDSGAENALNQARKSHRNGGLTDREFRRVREFITHEWPTFKNQIEMLPTAEEKEYRKLLKEHKIRLTE